MPDKVQGRMDTQVVREFASNLRRLEQLHAAQLREGIGAHGVAVAQCQCLLAVEDLDHPSQNELAEQLCLDKSTLSRTIEGLVRSGFVVRATDAVDRRVSRIRLTEKGEATCASINAANDALCRRILERLPLAAETVVETFASVVKATLAVKFQEPAEESQMEGD